MREAERCTGVTNAVFGAADGAPVRAERAPPLMGPGEGRQAGEAGFEKPGIQTLLAGGWQPILSPNDGSPVL